MKQILILSGKGGTGKTTIASAFIKLGTVKTYADCDVDAPNLHLITKWETSPQKEDYYGLDKAYINEDLCIKCNQCVLNCRFNAIETNESYKVNPFSCEGCSVCEHVCPTGAITMVPSVDGEMTLYSRDDEVFSTAELNMGSGTSGLLVTEVKKRMHSASKDVDLAIIDGSPGIGCPVIASLNGVDMVLIVAEPSISGINDMERIILTARHFDIKVAVCINKYDINLENSQKIENFCKNENLPFVGKIPYDSSAVKAINNGQTIVDIDCISGSAVKAVYEKTINLLLN